MPSTAIGARVTWMRYCLLSKRHERPAPPLAYMEYTPTQHSPPRVHA